MQNSQTPYQNTGKFSSLVVDYLENKESIRSFFGNYPDLAGFKNQMHLKSSFSAHQRSILAERLNVQYGGLKKDERVESNLAKLTSERTFTITTGHQLCLFTGPLYTVYKILHIVSLSRHLKENFPDHHFVPVFWMASEDHDFEEVNHVRIGGKKCVWNAEPGDGVGRINTANIQPIIDELEELLPKSDRTEDVLSDLREAYSHANLADATRHLVNKWFGQYGVVVVDGDDPVLKQPMIPAFSAELEDQVSYKAVSETNSRLEEQFKIQVTPREINLFYLNEGLRGRIEKTDSGFGVVDSKKSWTEESILNELQSNPERFSPNVLLRPLYQETILPNIAYIGGGGEVAYWSQLKDMFEAFEVPFPIVVLRQSIQIAPKRINRKREKLELSFEDLFKPTHELSNALVKRKQDFASELKPFEQEFNALFDKLEAIAGSENPDFKRTVAGQRQQNEKRLAHLQKRLIRSAKSKNEDQNRMLDEIKEVLMPRGGLQERSENIVPLLSVYGESLFGHLLEVIDPLAFQFVTLYE